MEGVVHSAECALRDAALEAARDAWNARWPKACAGCGGRGALYDHGNRDTPPDCDPCGNCSEEGICARCGEPGLTCEDRGDASTGEGPCKACGWNYDDRVPSVREEECGCELEALDRDIDADVLAGVLRVESSKGFIPDRRGPYPCCKNKIGSWRCGWCGLDVRKARGPCKAIPREKRYRIEERSVGAGDGG